MKLRPTYLIFVIIFLSLHFESSNPILLTSAPENLTQATQSTIGVIIAIGVTAFYICGIVVLIMTVVFSSQEAKKEFLGLNEEDDQRRYARSLPTDNSYLIDMALLLDTHSCMSRLLCEVEAEPELERSSEERMLLAIFEPSKSLLQGVRLENRKQLEKAKQIGKESKDVKVCGEKYNRCPLAADHLFGMWKMALHLRRILSNQLTQQLPKVF